MLHQPIVEDPDVAAAVADFRPTVIEIRMRSAKLFELADAAEPPRLAEQEKIADLIGTMEARCSRVGITIDELFAAINADLASSRENVFKPMGDYQRALLDENTRAHAADERSHRELTAAQERVRIATLERLAADRACGGIYAGWAIRGAR